MLSGAKKIHMVGIGGIGMSGIAQLLLGLGHEVSGSDIKSSDILDMLKIKGARVYIGHEEDNLTDADLVVYSSCIPQSNPELIKARRNSVPIVPRTDILAELMKGKTGITVSGAHGKTTTTSMISHLLVDAGLNPTVAVGGRIVNYKENARLGSGRFFVVETDESDGSFLKLNPTYSIITNIDREHLDFYKDFEGVIKAFEKFFGNTRRCGCTFFCSDDENLNKIASAHKARSISFGKAAGSAVYPLDITLVKNTSSFRCIYKNKDLGRFTLQIPGMHNVINSLAVIGLGMQLSIDLDIIKASLASFQGASRRFTIKFDQDNIMIIDDYAHHPTEIKATLAAAKNYGCQRIGCIFQPHRFTRTKFLQEEFGKSFSDADYVIVTDIYSASEKPIDGISAATICDRVNRLKGQKDVLYLSKDKINDHLMDVIKEGDMIIFLGAGDITKLSDELSDRLNDNRR